MTTDLKREDEWHKFSSIRLADGQRGFEIAAGINSRGDGPERTVGQVFGISDRDFGIAIAAPAMLNALREIDAFWSEDGASPDDAHWTDDMKRVWLNIRAAIAKAGA